MDVFFLDPARGDPSIIVIGVFTEFVENLRELEFKESRGIRMAAGVRELQGEIAHIMVTEIQAQILTFSHGQLGNFLEHDLFSLGAVAFLQLKSAHGLHDFVVQGGFQLIRPVEQLCVVERVKIFDNTDKSHISSIMILRTRPPFSL